MVSVERKPITGIRGQVLQGGGSNGRVWEVSSAKLPEAESFVHFHTKDGGRS